MAELYQTFLPRFSLASLSRAFAAGKSHVILDWMSAYSLYLHIPFCRHRCAYCDFNTYAGQDSAIPAYVDALIAEAAGVAGAAATDGAGEHLPVQTIFFGGGTPSLLPAESLARILGAIREGYAVAETAEITLEANPGTVTAGYLEALRGLGINRISFGMQSADPFELRQLERQHDPLDVIRAVAWARQAGFEQINLDLIYGLPDQAIETWAHTLEFALALRPEHLSLYALTIEEGTPLYRWASRGLVSQPDPDRAADMYELASERLDRAGFTQYEISNWATRSPDGTLLSCQHNLTYWRNQPYLGIGAGAHGYAGGYRTANVNGIASYIARIRAAGWQGFPLSPANATATPIDREMEIKETMMVGLRLVQEGVSAEAFKGRFGLSLMERYPREINELVGWGLLEWAGENDRRLRLTSRGRLLGNQVFMRFI